MGISRQTACVAMLVAGALTFFYVLLTATPSKAQSGPPDEGCASPREIEQFSGTENQLTPSFEIAGSTFRLTFDVVEVTDPNGFPQLEGDVINEEGQPIGKGFLTFEEDGSEVITEGPGTFSLEISANDVRYEIIVEDCGGTPPPPGPTPPTPPPDPTSTPTVQDNNKNRAKEVDKKTIPKRRLAPTGGIPASYVVYGIVLGGASLLALGLVRRGR